MFRADLHCHTTCSDGSYSPQDLVLYAKQIGLSAIAITDHDTMEAYKTAVGKAQEVGLILGTGIEFSCTFKDVSVHILGYDFLLDDGPMTQLCQQHEQRRLKRNREILKQLAKQNMPIQEEELFAKADKSIGRPHIAQIMVEKGYVPTIKHAFQHYLGDGKSAYVRGDPFSVIETIDILHQAQAKAFLAHPHLIDRRSIVKALLELPFDGIECYYGTFLADQEKKWIELAKEKKLLISGGSDFHGSVKPYVALGCSWVDEETFHTIFTRPIR